MSLKKAGNVEYKNTDNVSYENGQHELAFKKQNAVEIVNITYLSWKSDRQIDTNNSACGNTRKRSTMTGAAINKLCNPVFNRHDVNLSLKLHLLYARHV